MNLITVGASIDHAPDKSLQWLGKIGGFDEITAGQAGLGPAAREYVWADLNPQASVPQVLLFVRHVRVYPHIEWKSNTRLRYCGCVGKTQF